ncbi:MAG: hypothetical protein DMG26_00510 [Acidobacteria bacterium]|nr:MAG: hypothetical protein DMG26_00510 [Acidobacteriota bacterium]
MRRTRVGVCVLSLTGLLLSQALFGQSDRGIITGTVTDPSGGVISGVSVTATNSATGIATTTVSGQSGNYTIPLLRVGTYEVTAEQSGFKKYVQPGIAVDVAQTVSLDIRMQVGARTETVEVTAQATQLEKDTSERGTVVNGRDPGITDCRAGRATKPRILHDPRARRDGEGNIGGRLAPHAEHHRQWQPEREQRVSTRWRAYWQCRRVGRRLSQYPVPARRRRGIQGYHAQPPCGIWADGPGDHELHIEVRGQSAPRIRI